MLWWHHAGLDGHALSFNFLFKAFIVHFRLRFAFNFKVLSDGALVSRGVNFLIGYLNAFILVLMVLLLFVLEKSRFLTKPDAAPWVLAHVGLGTCVEVLVLFFVDFLWEFSQTKSALKSLDSKMMGILVSVLEHFWNDFWQKFGSSADGFVSV